MASTVTGAAQSTSTYTLPSNIKTTEQAKADAEKKALESDGGAMGQTAFLTLFTTQLKNQNPLDPMNNEAFVAQLAQFSQLEATTKMANNVETLVSSMTNDRMSAASSLIGKKVAIPDGKAILSNAQPVDGVIALDKDVDSVSIKVYAKDGSVVRTGDIGPQKKGDFTFSWDGKDSKGEAVADGVYRIEATATFLGVSSKPAVSTMAPVRTVTTDAVTGDMQVEFDDGSTQSMSQVKRVGL